MAGKEEIVGHVHHPSGHTNRGNETANGPFHRLFGADKGIEQMLAELFAGIVSAYISRPNNKERSPDIGQAGLL